MIYKDSAGKEIHVKLSREIVELSREMYAKWEQRKG